jgi:hypothetical protein
MERDPRAEPPVVCSECGWQPRTDENAAAHSSAPPIAT